MAIQCAQCGTTLKDGARFCSICGTLVPSHPFSPNRQKSFPPGTQGGALPKQLDFNTSPGSQPDTSEQEEKTQIVFPARALRAKVWEQNQNQSTDQNGHHSLLPSAQQPQGDEDEVEVEDLPTRPLAIETPTMVKPHSIHTTTSTPPSLPTPSPREKAPLSSVDQLDTVPIAIPGSIKPKAASTPVAEPVQPLRQSGQRLGSFSDRPAVQLPSPTSHPPFQHAIGSTAQDSRPSFPGAPGPATPVRRSRQRKGRQPLALILVILLLLIVGGGIGAWIVLEQPFTIAGVVQPRQTFSNTQLGVSLSYPNGWIAKIDTKKMTAFLSDSSQTAQFNVVSSAANGEDVGKFLQQEASQQGMTGLKPISTQSFAATSWQQLQGSILLNGASYTELLLATVHGQKMYTITELAPQSTYSQEEQYAFSGMRSSFQFIA